MKAQDALSLAESIRWTDAEQYLLSRGWKQMRSRLPEVGIYRIEVEGRIVEVVLPRDRDLADYAESIVSAAARIGRAEGRGEEAVLADMKQPRQDVVRFAQQGEMAADGTLPLDVGPEMLASVRRSLLAAAHGAERPEARFHRRMSRKRPEEFIAACRLGQTEVGSYVVSVMCPLDVGAQQELDPPFGRESVSYLFRSVHGVVDTFRRRGAGGIREALEEQAQPVINANLCDALVAMMPSNERGSLMLRVSWSPVVAPPELPTAVRIEPELFTVFEDIAFKLRPRVTGARDHFVGRVIELHGEDNAEGQLEGEVVLQVQVGDELVRTRCSLGPEEYRRAVAAHGEQRFLSLHGVLYRRPKVSFLGDVADIKVVE